jgi:murein DD-endopeptidase MepM/ murein hydrolase activator NlpD
LTNFKRCGVSLLLSIVLVLCDASYSVAACTSFGTPTKLPISLPLNLPILDQFRPPSCKWCSGNRGIEYRTVPGSVVFAAASGIVTFVGSVAGTNYVVIKTNETLKTGNNLLVTHGRLRSLSVKSGALVPVGQTIGTAGESLYIGVRENGQYTDPQQCASLGSTGKPRAVLVAG